ncbi:MAG: hypothetical protein NZ874_06395 [Fimbriimonadales bacterium]|nr:hypothetical protein [Fimbriimonadales bacterium]
MPAAACAGKNLLRPIKWCIVETVQKVLLRRVDVSPMDVTWASRLSPKWLRQSCPSPNARTRLSVLRMHGLEARATQARRHNASATVRRHPAVVSRWRGRHRTVCRRRRDTDTTQTCSYSCTNCPSEWRGRRRGRRRDAECARSVSVSLTNRFDPHSQPLSHEERGAEFPLAHAVGEGVRG